MQGYQPFVLASILLAHAFSVVSIQILTNGWSKTASKPMIPDALKNRVLRNFDQLGPLSGSVAKPLPSSGLGTTSSCSD